MNKLFIAIVSVFVICSSANLKAQDNPTSLKEGVSAEPTEESKRPLNFRVYGGPEMAFLLNGDHSVMKGGRLGVNAGLEVNKQFSSKAYGILGLGIQAGGYERWVNNDPTIKSKSSFDQLTNLEIPIGIGFNLGKDAPKGPFVNFSVINSINLSSTSNFTTVPFGNLEVSSNREDLTFDKFNMGGRAEFGIKTLFEGKSYATFSLTTKAMLYNRFSTNSNQFTGLYIGALMGFYF